MTELNICNYMHANLIQRLQQKIHHLETISRIDGGNSVASGCAAIDQMLPDHGYKRGTLTEWFTPNSHNSLQHNNSGGHGADFLSLMAAQKACEDGGALVVIDPERKFYPPAAIAMGINSSNLIVLRSQNTTTENETTDNLENDRESNLFWAIDQSLRCPAVAAVWGPLDHIGERWFRRFQLSAESSGTMGFFVRPASALAQPSWSEVQWKLLHNGNSTQETRSSHPRQFHLRQVRLQLARCRGTHARQLIDLDINTITGSVRETNRAQRDHERTTLQDYRTPSKKGPLSVAAQLAHSKTRRHTKRA